MHIFMKNFKTPYILWVLCDVSILALCDVQIRENIFTLLNIYHFLGVQTFKISLLLEKSIVHYFYLCSPYYATKHHNLLYPSNSTYQSISQTLPSLFSTQPWQSHSIL